MSDSIWCALVFRGPGVRAPSTTMASQHFCFLHSFAIWSVIHISPLVPEAGKCLSSRPAWFTYWVPNRAGLHNETLSQNRREQTAREMYPLPFLEARNLKSVHLQGHVPSQVPEENSPLPLPAPGVSEGVGLSVCVSERVCKYEQLQARTHCSSQRTSDIGRHIRLCFTLSLLSVCCMGQTTGTLCLCGRCFAHWAVSPAQRLFLNKVTFGVATGHVFGKVNCSRQGYQGHHWGNDFPRSQNEKK